MSRGLGDVYKRQLLICPSIDFNRANALLSQLRRQQTNRRIFAAYYYYALTARQIETLRINGIDDLQIVSAQMNNAELKQFTQQLVSHLA